MFNRLLILGIFLGLVFYVASSWQVISNYFYFSPCQRPIGYRMGSIDSRFGISATELSTDAQEASNIWKEAYGKPLLVEEPTAKLTINLVYDERQSLSSKVATMGAQLNSEKSPLSSQIAGYQSRLADFKKKLTDLNSQIDYWNSKGGAPENVYNQLISEQHDLQSLAEQLNKTAESLNLSAQKYNLNVSEFNQTLSNLKDVLAAKPEEGLYKGSQDEIDIYLTKNKAELVHTLAHEMGHALGLPHNSNPKSIMYPFTSEALVATKEDLADLQQVCQKISVFKEAARKIQSISNF